MSSFESSDDEVHTLFDEIVEGGLSDVDRIDDGVDLYPRPIPEEFIQYPPLGHIAFMGDFDPPEEYLGDR